MRREQTLLLNTDWMGLSLWLETPVKEPPSGYLWRVYENGTNVWKMRRILYTDRGDKVLTLLSEPKSRLIDPRAALLEIENEWLYHGIGVRGIEDVLRKCCIYSVRGLSRLDLAVDFNPTPAQIETLVHLAKTEYRLQGKRNMVPWWSTNNQSWLPEQYRKKLIPHQISWGHKTTEVKWKCYYKTRELKEAAGNMGWDKPYIVDCWREARLDETNVWRLEVSMKGCNGLLWRGEPITQDCWGYHTVALMRDLYESRFVVRKEEGHKDKSNDTIVEFLPIKGLKEIRCRQYAGMAEHNGRIALLRALVKSLDDEQVLLDDASREDVLKHIESILRRDRLDAYFRGMVGDWFSVWAPKVRHDAFNATGYNGRYDILRVNEINKDIQPNKNFDL